MHRREALKTLAGVPLALRSARAKPARPNIVIMLADDLGYGDLGFHGCTDIRTPHLDGLAQGGVRFEHAYANAPVCSPTRAALLTGRYQQRAGIGHVINAREKDRGMTLDAMLLPEVLKPHGYASGIIGKWHLGYPREYFPTRQGFDYFCGFVAGNVDYFQHTDRLGVPDLWRNEEPIRDKRYMTELIADESMAFIDRHSEQPFFLYVPFSAPHDPFQGPLDAATAGDEERTRKANRTRAVYKSMVESLDQQVGRILQHLERRGLTENTAVFFMSDNGGVPEIARNTPFRGTKGTLWEGGIRSPLVANWKSHLPQGALRRHMAAGMDLFPTALEIAGVAAPANLKLDGVSLLAAARDGRPLKRDTLYFHYFPPESSGRWKAMVRSGWKYLHDNRGQEYLFHLEKDIGEERNLIVQSSGQAEAMKRDYQAWFEDVHRGAPPEPRVRP